MHMSPRQCWPDAVVNYLSGQLNWIYIYMVFYSTDDFYLHNFTVTWFRHYFEDDHEPTGAKMMMSN